jgi:hypothetical protein
MRAPLCGILAIDKTVDVLSVFIVVGKGHFDVLCLKVNNRITEFILIGIAVQQIQQSILAHEFPAIVIDDQPSIEVTIVPKLLVYII